MTFLRVSPATTSRPRTEAPSAASLAQATSVSMVGVPGVSYTCAAGSPSSGIAGGAGVITASTFAA